MARAIGQIYLAGQGIGGVGRSKGGGYGETLIPFASMLGWVGRVARAFSTDNEH